VAKPFIPEEEYDPYAPVEPAVESARPGGDPISEAQAIWDAQNATAQQQPVSPAPVEEPSPVAVQTSPPAPAPQQAPPVSSRLPARTAPTQQQPPTKGPQTPVSPPVSSPPQPSRLVPPSTSRQPSNNLPANFYKYKGTIADAAKRHNIPAAVLAGLLQTESNWDDDVISGKRLSSAGAGGIAQMMEATAKELGIDRFNPEQSIYGAAAYLERLQKYFGGDLQKAIKAYNTGAGNIEKGIEFDETRMHSERTWASAGLFEQEFTGTQDPAKASAPKSALAGVLDKARTQVGKRYAGPVIGEPDALRWGDPGYDCSSFVSAMFKEAGISLTPFTDRIADETDEVTGNTASRPGDLILFKYDDQYQPGVKYPHVGIYLGDGKMIDASYGRGVAIRSIEEVDQQFEIRRVRGLSDEEAQAITQQSEATGAEINEQQPPFGGRYVDPDEGSAAGVAQSSIDPRLQVLLNQQDFNPEDPTAGIPQISAPQSGGGYGGWGEPEVNPTTQLTYDYDPYAQAPAGAEIEQTDAVVDFMDRVGNTAKGLGTLAGILLTGPVGVIGATIANELGAPTGADDVLPLMDNSLLRDMDRARGGVVGALGAIVNGGDILGEAWKGLENPQEFSTTGLLYEKARQEGREPGLLEDILGFAGDAVLDPANLAGGIGAIVKGGKLIGMSDNVLVPLVRAADNAGIGGVLKTLDHNAGRIAKELVQVYADETGSAAVPSDLAAKITSAIRRNANQADVQQEMDRLSQVSNAFFKGEIIDDLAKSIPQLDSSPTAAVNAMRRISQNFPQTDLIMRTAALGPDPGKTMHPAALRGSIVSSESAGAWALEKDALMNQWTKVGRRVFGKNLMDGKQDITAVPYDNSWAPPPGTVRDPRHTLRHMIERPDRYSFTPLQKEFIERFQRDMIGDGSPNSGDWAMTKRFGGGDEELAPITGGRYFPTLPFQKEDIPFQGTGSTMLSNTQFFQHERAFQTIEDLVESKPNFDWEPRFPVAYGRRLDAGITSRANLLFTSAVKNAGVSLELTPQQTILKTVQARLKQRERNLQRQITETSGRVKQQWVSANRANRLGEFLEQRTDDYLAGKVGEREMELIFAKTLPVEKALDDLMVAELDLDHAEEIARATARRLSDPITDPTFNTRQGGTEFSKRINKTEGPMPKLDIEKYVRNQPEVKAAKKAIRNATNELNEAERVAGMATIRAAKATAAFEEGAYQTGKVSKFADKETADFLKQEASLADAQTKLAAVQNRLSTIVGKITPSVPEGYVKLDQSKVRIPALQNMAFPPDLARDIQSVLERPEAEWMRIAGGIKGVTFGFDQSALGVHNFMSMAVSPVDTAAGMADFAMRAIRKENFEHKILEWRENGLMDRARKHGLMMYGVQNDVEINRLRGNFQSRNPLMKAAAVNNMMNDAMFGRYLNTLKMEQFDLRARFFQKIAGPGNEDAAFDAAADSVNKTMYLVNRARRGLSADRAAKEGLALTSSSFVRGPIETTADAIAGFGGIKPMVEIVLNRMDGIPIEAASMRQLWSAFEFYTGLTTTAALAGGIAAIVGLSPEKMAAVVNPLSEDFGDLYLRGSDQPPTRMGLRQIDFMKALIPHKDKRTGETVWDLPNWLTGRLGPLVQTGYEQISNRDYQDNKLFYGDTAQQFGQRATHLVSGALPVSWAGSIGDVAKGTGQQTMDAGQAFWMTMIEFFGKSAPMASPSFKVNQIKEDIAAKTGRHINDIRPEELEADPRYAAARAAQLQERVRQEEAGSEYATYLNKNAEITKTFKDAMDRNREIFLGNVPGKSMTIKEWTDARRELIQNRVASSKQTALDFKATVAYFNKLEAEEAKSGVVTVNSAYGEYLKMFDQATVDGAIDSDTFDDLLTTWEEKYASRPDIMEEVNRRLGTGVEPMDTAYRQARQVMSPYLSIRKDLVKENPANAKIEEFIKEQEQAIKGNQQLSATDKVAALAEVQKIPQVRAYFELIKARQEWIVKNNPDIALAVAQWYPESHAARYLKKNGYNAPPLKIPNPTK